LRQLLWLVLGLAGCASGDKIGTLSEHSFKPDFSAGPPSIVYKTKKDYRNNVPVILSANKNSIVSYPAPADLLKDGTLLLPTVLSKGYLLDNKGITADVAFLKLTYKEYAALKMAPPSDSLYAMIIDKDPLTEMCNCGNRYALKNPVRQINALIRRGQLRMLCKAIR
jgi:hypothetical protein